MAIRTVAARLLAVLPGLTSLLGTCAFGAVIAVPKYNVSVDEVSVSGFSSGAHMAAQMHFAYSKTIRKGAGIVAGGPIYCSQGNIVISVGPCMANTGSRNLPYLMSVVNTWSGNGYIDPTSNMSASKVYLLSGTIDSTVRQPVMDDLKTMYANYLPTANIYYKNNLTAEHSVPTDFFGNGCSVNGGPYVNNCNFDTAGDILKWIYGPLNAKNAGALSGSFINFDQSAFWGNLNPEFYSMAGTGYAYVPAMPMYRLCLCTGRLLGRAGVQTARRVPRLPAERIGCRHRFLSECGLQPLGRYQQDHRALSADNRHHQ